MNQPDSLISNQICYSICKEFGIQLYMRQYWKDDRLQYAEEFPHTDYIDIVAEGTNNIWRPGTTFIPHDINMVGVVVLTFPGQMEDYKHYVLRSKVNVIGSMKCHLSDIAGSNCNCSRELEAEVMILPAASPLCLT